MNSVLISIQPKWCELIASGKKTIEVRKTRPKIDTPFKVYIYCTKKPVSVSFSGTGKHISEYDKTCYYNERSGKVIGEFVCDNIVNCLDINMDSTCLTVPEWLKYTKGHKGNVWGWHISDLVIYDKPKELDNFIIVDREALKQCEHRERVYQNPDYVNGAWLFGGYVCNKGEIDWCCDCKRKPLKRPPQSWCYVENDFKE